MRRLLSAAAFVAVLAICPRPAQAQCAMCKTALASSPEGRLRVDSFNRAILLLLAAPYVVAGTVAAVLFRERLKVAALLALGRLRHKLTAA